MALEWIRPKTIIPMAVVFLALVVVLLWIAENEDNEPAQEEPLQLSRIQIKQGNELVDLSEQVPLSDAELAQLIRARIQLLSSPDLNDRRATAAQLAHMTADPAERARLQQLGPAVTQELRSALFKALNDPDPVLAAECRDALVGLWRMCDSDAASEYFSQGLAAYEAGQPDRALETFNSVEGLGGPVPPDLYRMTAEIYLAQQKFNMALEECRKAVRVEPRNFPALYVLARIYHAQGDDEKALKALDGTLLIYHTYPEALRLRQQIMQQRPAPSVP
jgi:tetratricopeptide (TPR) repeat protein